MDMPCLSEPSVPDGAAPGSQPVTARLRGELLARLRDFAVVRRSLGAGAAGELVSDAAARLAATLPLAQVLAVGQDVIRVRCGGALDEVEHVSAAVRAFFEPADERCDDAARLGWAVGSAIAAPEVDDVTLAETS